LTRERLELVLDFRLRHLSRSFVTEK